ncbi:MAG TPA: hypothetical protein VFH61_09535 [Thermoleophilia bacterium]|nr:hypothetical protein [Thermoleophilia bacterium]
MEAILTSPIVRVHMLPEAAADALLDRLSKIDLRACDGQGDDDSLLDILAELVDVGVVDAEVWRLYCKPASASEKAHKHKGEGL